MPVPFNPLIFIAFVLVFATAVAIFCAHMIRYTRNHRWFALRDWAARNNYSLYGARKAAVPIPLAGLTLPPPTATIALAGARAVFLEFTTPASPHAPASAANSAAHATSATHASSTPSSSAPSAPPTLSQPRRFHALIRELPVDWPPTALRPVSIPTSLVDLFGLSDFPALMASDRFTLHGQDPAAARLLSKSMLGALLPHDVAMILHGRRLILDFSTRHFDAIDLSRILSLAEQLIRHLPARS